MLAIGLVGLQGVLLLSIFAASFYLGEWNVWGGGLWLLAFVVFGLAYANLGKSLTPSPIPNQRGLKTGGIYSLIRHPMYLSLLLFGLGGLVFSTWSALPLFLLIILLMVKIAMEEGLLLECYPEYKDYREKTKKLIPFIW